MCFFFSEVVNILIILNIVEVSIEEGEKWWEIEGGEGVYIRCLM